MLALAELVELAAQAAMVALTVGGGNGATGATGKQVPMETTPTALAAPVALAARQVAQPVSTSVAYPTSHSRTMAPFKEERLF